jgi:hypothetical protein
MNSIKAKPPLTNLSNSPRISHESWSKMIVNSQRNETKNGVFKTKSALGPKGGEELTGKSPMGDEGLWGKSIALTGEAVSSGPPIAALVGVGEAGSGAGASDDGAS